MTHRTSVKPIRRWISIAIVYGLLLGATWYYHNVLSARSVNHLVVLTYSHDITPTLIAMSLEWKSYRDKFGREPQSEDELLAARPALRVITRSRPWSRGEPFAFVIPPSPIEGDLVVAVSPNVHAIDSPLWPSGLHERFSKWIDARSGITVDGRFIRVPTGFAAQRRERGDP